MNPKQIIRKQQDILQNCKKEFVAAIAYNSLNDEVANNLINKIDSICKEVENEKVINK